MIENKTIDACVKDIKQSFRLMMNGITAKSMRDKGLDYHLNWGISLPDLKNIAKKYGKNYELAIALWKEDIRECKILATMIMPADKVSHDVIELWIEQTHTLEIAEQAALNLYQYLPFAKEEAYQLIASDNEIRQICGHHVLSRLFMNGTETNKKETDEFIDQIQTAISSESVALKKAAIASIIHFSELGASYANIAHNTLNKLGMDL